MRALVVATAIAIVVTFVPSHANAQEAIFLVRHAERLNDSSDSPLSADGQARAWRLGQMLRDARITGIYVSEYQRTVQTAKPLADALKIPSIQTPAADPTTLVAKLHALGRQARVLVVSHADRLPALLQMLGVTENIDIPASQYDDLFLLLPNGSSPPALIRLKY